MRSNVRRLVLGGVGLGLAAWVLAAPGGGTAADKEGDGKALREGLGQVADCIAAGDPDGARKRAAAVAKETDDLGEVMGIFKLRKKGANKGGVGVGATPEQIKPDGIEAYLQAVAENPPEPGLLKKQVRDLVRMAHLTAAVALVAEARTDDDGKKDAAQWRRWAKDMHAAAMQLADAASAKNPMQVKQMALKLTSSCTSCHKVFRD